MLEKMTVSRAEVKAAVKRVSNKMTRQDWNALCIALFCKERERERERERIDRVETHSAWDTRTNSEHNKEKLLGLWLCCCVILIVGISSLCCPKFLFFLLRFFCFCLDFLFCFTMLRLVQMVEFFLFFSLLSFIGLPRSDAAGSDRFSVASARVHAVGAHLPAGGLCPHLLRRT